MLGVTPALAHTTSASVRAVVRSANVQVSKDQYLAHSEPSVAENPRNPKNLIAGSKMFTVPSKYQFKIGTYYTKDGGKTWHDNGFLPGFDNYSLTSDISFDFDAQGRAYACVLATDDSTGISGIFVSVSSDGGKTWSDPHAVFLDPTGTTFSDKPWIGIDRSTGPHRGSIYVVWNLDGNNAAGQDPDAGRAASLQNHQVAETSLEPGLVVARSTDKAATWSAPVMLVPFPQNSQQFALGAIPQVDPKGRVRIAYLKWNDSPSGTYNTFEMRTSTDGGATFGPARTIVNSIQGLPNTLKSGTFRNLSLPTFAVSPKNGSMALAWSDIRNGDADVLLVRSKDGVTWSKPYRVNHDALRNGKDQIQPELAVAPNGVYTCAWFDRRHDPKNLLIDEEIAQSTDNATTFGHNFRVTTRSWNPSIGAPIPTDDSRVTFIGDYQGLAVDNNTVHPLWNDTQNGTSQQIRTAVISVTLFDRKK